MVQVLALILAKVNRVDFVNKLNIALKEGDETRYWLTLLNKADVLNQQQFESMYNDCTELIKLLTSIIRTSKEV